MKKGAFDGRRPSLTSRSTADDWVQNRDQPVKEPTKRLTIDVPVSLHQRVKSQCALQNLAMADVIRELLQLRFTDAPQHDLLVLPKSDES